MMHDREKSDPAIVAEKPTNKAGQPAAESAEPRVGAEGNASWQSTHRTQGRERVSQALERVRQVARQRKKEKFTALLHHVSVDLLGMAFFALKRDAAPGVDGLTWRTYEADLDRNLTDLHERVHRGAYRALPSRRTYIPKADGKQRPLAVAALEDKIVQRATVAVLNAIYEEDFLGFSYGFRPKRGQHDALDALAVGIGTKRVNFILDADVASFFDSVSKEKLVRFVEHRVGDPRIVRLIQKWLKAGVLEDGVVTVSESGTGQGSVVSPLLANVYLHYTFDLWAERWRRREATGDMIIVRYADDIIVGFEHEADARRFWEIMRERMQEFSLSLNSEKTRLIEFGRHAVDAPGAGSESRRPSSSWGSPTSGLGQRRLRGCLDRADRLSDRHQHLAPVPKQNAEVFEVLFCQVGKHRDIDTVLGKALRVLAETELFEPVRNLLHCGAASGGIYLEQTELLTARARKEADPN